MRLPPGGAQDEDDTLARKARGENLGERLDDGGADHRLLELTTRPADQRARAVGVGRLAAMDFVVALPLVLRVVEEFGKLALAVVFGAVHQKGDRPFARALAQGLARLAQGCPLFLAADTAQICQRDISG